MIGFYFRGKPLNQQRERMNKKTLVMLFGILNISFIVVIFYLQLLQPDYRNLFQSNIDSFFNMAFTYYIAFSIMLIFNHSLDCFNSKNSGEQL